MNTIDRRQERTASLTRFAGDWTAAPRFSRRMGEACRGAEYACAIEGPMPTFVSRLMLRWVAGSTPEGGPLQVPKPAFLAHQILRWATRWGGARRQTDA